MDYIINNKWAVVIGLEIHCQLKTKTKLFSRSSTEFGKPQNSCVSFYDCAMPGQLPVINKYSVEQAVKIGLALKADINLQSRFDRKNYFYADLPSGYQITQFFKPIIRNGKIEIELANKSKKTIGIHEAHLEQDAAKLVHDQHPTCSLVDLNRSGTTLLEIVSEPDMRSPEEAMAYVRKIRSIVRALDACDGNMDEGSMRCDVNVSVMPVNSKTFGTRCEIKNINSIKNIGDAIVYESQRQVSILEEGGKIEQETRKFNALTSSTSTMRSKEDAIDYRYFPDPDLSVLKLTEEFVNNIRKKMPELPEEKKQRYIKNLQLNEYDADVLTSSPDISNYFENLIKNGHGAKIASNWLTSELFGRLNKKGVDLKDSPVTADKLGELLTAIENNIISGKIAKNVLDIMLETGENANTIIEKNGLKQNVNEDEIIKVIEEIIKNNPSQVQDYKNGNERIFGYFVGQVMKATNGKTNPKLANELLKQKLKD